MRACLGATRPTRVGAIYLPRLTCVNNSEQVNCACMEKGAMSRGYLLSFQNLKRFSHQLNSKNNGLNSFCSLSQKLDTETVSCRLL